MSLNAEFIFSKRQEIYVSQVHLHLCKHCHSKIFYSLHISEACAGSLNYLARTVNAPNCHLWPVHIT